MLHAIIIALIGTADTVIIRVMIYSCIMELMTITVICHECMDICMVVTQEHRCRMLVVRREMSPVPWRMPWFIRMMEQMCDDGRCGEEHWFYDIGRTIDVWSTDNLDIIVVNR